MSEIQTHQPGILHIPLIAPGEQLKRPELADLNRWVKEQVMKLPEMRVAKSPLTDQKTWKEVRGTDDNLDAVYSPFFSVQGIDVTTADHTWHQGAVVQRGEFLPTQSGEKTEVSGAVLLLKNSKGETLVTMSQEPLAHAQFRSARGDLSIKKTPQSTEVHPIVRSSIQTSIQKLQLVARNEALGHQYDHALTAILTAVAKDHHATVTEILNTTPLSKAPTDANRISGNVVYGMLTVSDALAKTISQEVPGSRWCSQQELDALTVSGLTNGHLNIARTVTEAQERSGKTKQVR